MPLGQMELLNNRKFADVAALQEAARKIKLIALDVDGVLTDGRIGYTGTPDEIKFFYVRDGSGITMLHRAGILVGIISGRVSKANQTRAAELKMDFLVEKCWNKAESIRQIAEEKGVSPDECLFIGDDLIDGAAMQVSGIGVAVGDASPEVLPAADVQTSAFGGHGAVREVAEWLLKLQGKWDMQLEHYHIPKK